MITSYVVTLLSESGNLPELLRDWREDTMVFLRHDVPKILLIIVVAFGLVRLVRVITNRITALETHKLHSGLRSRQVQTLASVLTSIRPLLVSS